MKISDYENEEAIELLADILEPTAHILSDKEIMELYSSGIPKIRLVQAVLKHHAKEVVNILAVMDGVAPDEYKGNLVTMTKSLLDILNDEALKDFFMSQAQTEAQTYSGSATENIKGQKK